MNNTDLKHKELLEILQKELILAMGCTEPIAVAYCAAKACELLRLLPSEVRVGVSGSILKNIKSVIVPNTGSLKGVEAAVAAGIVAGNPAKSLQVIADIPKEKICLIKEFIQNVPIQVYLIENQLFDIVISMKAQGHSAAVRINKHHTNIVYMQKDDEILLDLPIEESEQHVLNDALNAEDIWEFVQAVDINEVEPLITKQMTYNWKIAKEGIDNCYGAAVGKMLMKTHGDSVRNHAIAMAAAGSDARMDGCELPVVINSGSGNQGITVCVPVMVYAKELNVDKDKTYRAILLANLISIYIKSGIGTLSAYCGAVTAGAAAGAGIAYLQGGNLDAVKHTVVNALAVVSGIVCDGAKPSCAAKIAHAVEAGISGYELYQTGHEFFSGEGIVSDGFAQTITNIARLGRDGMKQTNTEIINMMLSI